MQSWEIGLLVVAGYIAVTSLVRLMLSRRAELLNRFRQEMEQEQRRRKTQESKQTVQAGVENHNPDRAG